MSEKKRLRRLTFGSKQIYYDLQFQERRTLGIKVYPDCSVRVIAPVGSSLDKVATKVKEKAPWILKQQNEFLSYHPLIPPRRYINGETHLYLGRQYRLKIEASNVDDVKLNGGRMVIRTTDQDRAKKLLAEWYRAKAARHFFEILQQQFLRFNRYLVKEPALQIRSMATRWGSCTVRGRIILNPELIKAPRGCIEYVIIHELCHLVHRNHTKSFYALQERIMPDWKNWKERLEALLASAK